MALEYGQAFTHSTTVFQVAGIPLLSLKNITVKSGTVKAFNRGTGRYPVSYGTAHKEDVEVSFQISKSDTARLQDGAPNGDIEQIQPFDIPRVHVNPQSPRLDTLKGFMITGLEEGSETGGTDIMDTITGIAWNEEHKAL